MVIDTPASPELNILIVDDDEDICEILKTYFELKDFKVTSVSNGRDAIDEISKNVYNVVFLDNFLPDINGLNILRRGILKKEYCYVVFMTGDFQKNMMKETVKIGVNEILLKPFSLTDVANIIERATNFFKSIFNFKEAVSKIESSEINIVTDNNVHLIKSISKILVRNICDANFFEDEMQVVLAINELIANAIYHGNLELDSELKREAFENFFKEAEKRQIIEPYCSRKVYITSYFNSIFFEITVKDEGKGFDWKNFLMNYERGEILPYGRGLLIIFSVFDEITWNKQGNEITVIKYKNS